MEMLWRLTTNFKLEPELGCQRVFYKAYQPELYAVSPMESVLPICVPGTLRKVKHYYRT